MYGGADAYRHRILTLLAMRLAYTLLSRGPTKADYDNIVGMFSDTHIINAVLRGLYSERDCRVRAAPPPIFSPSLSNSDKAYTMMVLWHMASAKDLKSDCALSHEMQMVFWVPADNLLGAARGPAAPLAPAVLQGSSLIYRALLEK